VIARAVNAAADVIHRAQVNGTQTATGIAIALESAQLLQSPETVAESAVSAQAVQLAEASVAELRREHEENARLRERIATLEVAVESPELCADCGHMEDAHSKGGETDCTSSDARVFRCGCSYFIPRYGAAELVIVPAPESLEDPHDSPLAHTYRIGRDLPELGGA
jgi:hypothetical protein